MWRSADERFGVRRRLGPGAFASPAAMAVAVGAFAVTSLLTAQTATIAMRRDSSAGSTPTQVARQTVDSRARPSTGVAGPVRAAPPDARVRERASASVSRSTAAREAAPPLSSEHRWLLIATLATLAAQSLIIAALLRQRRRRSRSLSALAAAELRFRTIVEAGADLVYEILPDGRFDYMSPSCLTITGHGPEAFLARPSLFDDIVADEDRQRWREYRQSDRRAETCVQTEVRIRTTTGEKRWLGVAESQAFGPDGRLRCVRGTARDMTERRDTEARLQTALVEIERLRDQLEIDNALLGEGVSREAGIDGMLGASDTMSYVVAKVRQVAPTGSTVLLLGETGVGKSHLAHAIHDLSPRRSRPLVTLDCAALPPSLIEAELFGHERGAFTGAHTRRIGRFEAAHGSTLLLDEVGELPLELQGKLLRAVQEGEFERVGSSVPIRVDVRLIAATNADLEELVRLGRFRRDLWYRLNVFPVTLPPLRRRAGDIPILVMHFLEKQCRKLGRSTFDIAKADMRWLQAQPWHGNLRELEAFIERCAIQSSGSRLDVSAGQASTPAASSNGDEWPDVVVTLEELERRHIRHTLDRLHWRVAGKGGAAEQLGMNPSTLRSRMQKLGIARDDHAAPVSSLAR